MKILYIHQYFNTPLMPGSTRSFEFAKRLVDRGDTVYMVTSNWQGKSNKSFTNESGIKVFWAPLRYSNKMNFMSRLMIFFQFLWYVLLIGNKLKYDLIIASSTPLTVVLPALYLKKKKMVKLVLELRDLWPQLPIAIGAIKSSFLIKLSRMLEKKAYLNSDHVVVLSKGMANELKGKISKKKLSVVTNLCDTNSFYISPKKGYEFRKKIALDKNSPLIIYAGSFGKINGVSYLVDIAKEMKQINKNIKFLLSGDGYEKIKIINKAKNYSLLDKTFFIRDYLPKNEMPSLLSAATITTSFFIDLPEMENNSANKFFDGLAAGKPIMINYQGWQADLLKKTNAGFIIPKNDPLKAAEIINDKIKNSKNLEAMGKEAYKLSLKFDIKLNFNKLKKILDDILLSNEIGLK
jgi:glycosyltransferase involved in cell wall biosynthesis